MAYVVMADANLPLRLSPYHILPISAHAGFIEVIPDAVSISTLKKKFGGRSLYEIFGLLYGDAAMRAHKQA